MTRRRFGCQRQQRLQVAGRAVEVGLQHGADVVQAVLSQTPVDAQCGVDELRLLHVDADEAAELDETPDVSVRELLVDLEPEVGELERDVRPQLLGGDALDHLAVRGDDGLRVLGLEHAFAEQRRVRPQPLLVQTAQNGDALVERLACDEARRPEAHPVAAHEALDAAAVGRGEDALPQARVDRDAQLCDRSHSLTSRMRRSRRVRCPSDGSIRASTRGMRSASQRPCATGTNRSSSP